mmetsp:Transcript_50760/g.122404  ORF Transcript_50760/g.122404 Transcript_50760/m.122404 type:complete len:318 (-) Transcript_50760:1562-2515(-)
MTRRMASSSLVFSSSLLLSAAAVAVFLVACAAQYAQAQDVQPTLAPSTLDPRTVAPTAEGTGWTGCVDPFVGPLPVNIGSQTTVCLVLSNAVDWASPLTYMRLHFQPTADTYSRFHIPNSYNQLVQAPDLGSRTGLSATFPGNITVHSESQTALSFQKQYFDGSDRIFPYLTAVIDVKDGVVQGISWDDACLFCSSGECQPNTYNFAGNLATESEAQQPIGGCYITRDQCDAAHQDGRTDCDLLLYVVWTGTDGNGKDFRSSANRFSAFPAQSWTDRISQNLPASVSSGLGFGGGDDSGDGAGRSRTLVESESSIDL